VGSNPTFSTIIKKIRERINMDILGCIFLIILCLTAYAIITADKVDIKISVDGKEVFKYNKKDTNEKDAPDDKN
jgi:uncharacterized protein YabE (DUF348 family)